MNTINNISINEFFEFSRSAFFFWYPFSFDMRTCFIFQAEFVFI